ncbi:MAG: ABC transporter permease [Terriglobales bacterium]
METLLQDVRYGWRMLRKSPGFTAIAVIALALGIASTTAIFSVVDVVLLHPLPYPDASRILSVGESQRSTGEGGGAASPANYLDWAAQNHVFAHMAASRGWPVNLSGGARPQRVQGTMTSPDFFSLFGVPPILGRTLLPDDNRPGNDHVVVLGSGVWKRLFGSDRALVGQNITLNGEPYTVVGVMPASFNPDEYGELWLPSRWGVPANPLRPDEDPRTIRDSHYMDAWARLKPGVTLQQARQEMDAIALRLEKQYPNSNNDTGVSLIGMQDNVVSDIRPTLLLLLVAVAFVLLIGCANVANLLLARATTRTKEVSIRAALGASRLRVIRQLLTESVVLALMGGVAGVLLAAWAVPALLAMSPPDIREFAAIGVNREVLGFGLLVSLLSGIVFGLAPALQASRWNLNESLKEGERGSTASHGRTRSVLVVAEVGLSLILLVGSGLLVKSFVRLMQVDPGFDGSRLLVFNVGLPPSTTPPQQDDFYHQVVERLQALPGVQSAGAVSRLPLAGGNSSRSFKVPGSDKDYDADIRVSTPSYFQTMGIALLKGRTLSEQDAHSPVQVAVINEALARDVFPGEDPVGKYIVNFGPLSEKIQIVGVVGNVRHVGLETAPRPEVYLAFGQAHWPSAFMVVRSKTSDPLALAVAAQNAVGSVNKDIPLANLRTMQDVIAQSVLRRRFAMLLLSIFSGLAMLLAGIGLYGVMSYTVSQRTHEIGIRMALGAQKRDVLKLVVGQGMKLAALGVAAGVVASMLLTRLMASLLFGVSARDPFTFGALAVLLAVVALIANYVPARRAAKVDPMVALRYE